MDTSNSSSTAVSLLHFKADRLQYSDHEEDRELYRVIKETVGLLVTRLVPILKHIAEIVDFHHIVSEDDSCATHKIKAVFVHRTNADPPVYLILDDHGNFFRVTECTKNAQPRVWACHDLRDADDAWSPFMVQDVLDGLQALLTEAVEKREHFLKAIAMRRDLLVRIQSVIKDAGETQAS